LREWEGFVGRHFRGSGGVVSLWPEACVLIGRFWCFSNNQECCLLFRCDLFVRDFVWTRKGSHRSMYTRVGRPPRYIGAVGYLPTSQIRAHLHRMSNLKSRKTRSIDVLPTDPFGVVRSTLPHMAILLTNSNIVSAY
jgi:hypothetical protein